MTTVLWILGLVAALVVALFAGQNAEPVRVNFLVWQTSSQLPVVIFVSAALGAAVAGVLGAIPLARARIRLRHLTAELAQARPGAAQQQPAGPPQPAAQTQPAAQKHAAGPPQPAAQTQPAAPPQPPLPGAAPSGLSPESLPAPQSGPAESLDAALAEALAEAEKAKPGESAGA